MRLIRVDTRYWHALGEIEMYHLLILWRQLVRLQASAWSISKVKVFSALIIVLPKVISGAPLAVSCREAKKRANVWASDERAWRLTCPKVQAIAIDGGRCIMYCSALYFIHMLNVLLVNRIIIYLKQIHQHHCFLLLLFPYIINHMCRWHTYNI